MISWNCKTGNHGGCNHFHLGCRCEHHPRGAHLTPEGRFSFVDVDTYPNLDPEDLMKHRFYTKRGRHERKRK